MGEGKYDAGIFYCDADKETGVKSSNRIAVTKHYETVYKEVKDGLNSDKGIPMIPLSMIECWILADKSALEQVFELEIQQAKCRLNQSIFGEIKMIPVVIIQRII